MAIAFDASSQGATNSGVTSLTVSHTCTGSNGILFTYIAYQGTDRTISGATYNGVSMTAVYNNQIIASALTHALFYIVNPATGANNIVVTMSGSTGQRLGMCSASYTGAKQTGVPDAQNVENSFASVSSRTLSVTTVADNCWLVGGVMTGVGVSAGSSTTIRTTNPSPMDYEIRIYDSNGPRTPAGSQGLTINVSPSNGLPMIVASFAPSVAAANGNFLNFM